MDPSAGMGYVGSAAVLKVGTLLDERTDIWRKSWEVNVLGNIIALPTLLPLMVAAPHASVVAVSSIDASSVSSNSPPTRRARPR